jgi:hypothetical protein
MLNNVEDTRVGTLFMDVDYSTMSPTGSNSPINFDLIISGSAFKFPIPDSNYTTRRHREPRYDGVKNTSDRTNVWSTASYGTYGKTPSADDLRTAVAYCESITSAVPERLGTSTAFVKYLINQDGTVSTPNVTPFSLQLNQGNFQTGERVFLATQNSAEYSTFQGPDYNTNYREVVRGATRVEPILHNQSGSSPAQWTSSIEFENRSAAAVGNYIYDGVFTVTNTVNGEPFFYLTPGPDYPMSGSGFPMPLSLKQDGCEITANISFLVENDNDDNDARFQTKIQFIPLDNTKPTIDITSIYDPGPFARGNPQTVSYNSLNLSPSFISNLSLPGHLSIWIDNLSTYNSDVRIKIINSSFTTTQSPLPGEQPSITITSSIWEPTTFPSPSWGIKLKNTSDGNQLYNLYLTNQINPTWYFKGIDNSGYNKPSNQMLTPWDIRRGDEFRFNDNADYIYLVDYVVTGSTLEVYFDKTLNTNPAPFDINHYSITRYVDDASKILIKGFRPNNTDGPYILRPEFVVPELDKGIDEFIVDLTQKGLL